MCCNTLSLSKNLVILLRIVLCNRGKPTGCHLKDQKHPMFMNFSSEAYLLKTFVFVFWQ
jgi:hypothetical protein